MIRKRYPGSDMPDMDNYPVPSPERTPYLVPNISPASVVTIGTILPKEKSRRRQASLQQHLVPCQQTPLTRRPGFYQACFANNCVEARRNKVTLHDDDPRALQYLLLSLVTTDSSHSLSPLNRLLLDGSLRTSRDSNMALANIAQLADKYCYPSLRTKTLSILERKCKSISGVTEAVQLYEDVVDTLGEYPEELYPVFWRIVKRDRVPGALCKEFKVLWDVVMQDERLDAWIAQQVGMSLDEQQPGSKRRRSDGQDTDEERACGGVRQQKRRRY